MHNRGGQQKKSDLYKTFNMSLSEAESSVIEASLHYGLALESVEAEDRNEHMGNPSTHTKQSKKCKRRKVPRNSRPRAVSFTRIEVGANGLLYPVIEYTYDDSFQDESVNDSNSVVASDCLEPCEFNNESKDSESDSGDDVGTLLFCDSSTISASGDETINLGQTYSGHSDSLDVGVRKGGCQLISADCIVGLLSRYIDATPALQSSPIRLLVTKSAVGGREALPAQIIRYKSPSTVDYEILQDHFGSSSIFNCVRQDGKKHQKEPTECSGDPTNSKVDKLLVVLDLDETLIHMHDRSNDHYDFLLNIIEVENKEATCRGGGLHNNDIIGFVVHPNMYVSLRPGVMEFIKYLRENSSIFEAALYTAGTRHYANAIMQSLDPKGEVIKYHMRHFRDSCEATATPETLRTVAASRLGLGNHHSDEIVPTFYFKKNLEVFGWSLERVVFFDNSLLSFMNNPENGAWVKPWRGVKHFLEQRTANMTTINEVEPGSNCDMLGRENLYEFKEIVNLLEELKDVQDVREYLRDRFTLSELVGNTQLLVEKHPEAKPSTTLIPQ